MELGGMTGGADGGCQSQSKWTHKAFFMLWCHALQFCTEVSGQADLLTGSTRSQIMPHTGLQLFSSFHMCFEC